jgi:hypothetical protein
MVEDEGIEPSLRASETPVLPLDQSSMIVGSQLWIRTSILEFKAPRPTIRRSVNDYFILLNFRTKAITSFISSKFNISFLIRLHDLQQDTTLSAV